jgi:serine/threonine protein kinase
MTVLIAWVYLFYTFFKRKALKIIRINQLSTQEYEMAKLEANILKKHKHPNIVEFFDFFEDFSFNGSHCMAMLHEYCPVNQKNFKFFIKKINE